MWHNTFHKCFSEFINVFTRIRRVTCQGVDAIWCRRSHFMQNLHSLPKCVCISTANSFCRSLVFLVLLPMSHLLNKLAHSCYMIWCILRTWGPSRKHIQKNTRAKNWELRKSTEMFSHSALQNRWYNPVNTERRKTLTTLHQRWSISGLPVGYP